MKDKVIMERRYSYFLAALLAKLKEDMEEPQIYRNHDGDLYPHRQGIFG